MRSVPTPNAPGSVVVNFPVVRYGFVERIQSLGLRRIVNVGRAVDHDRHVKAHALVTVPDLRGTDYERVVVGAEEDLHQLTPGGGIRADVIAYKLVPSVDAGVVKRHLSTNMSSHSHPSEARRMVVLH